MCATAALHAALLLTGSCCSAGQLQQDAASAFGRQHTAALAQQLAELDTTPAEVSLCLPSLLCSKSCAGARHAGCDDWADKTYALQPLREDQLHELMASLDALRLASSTSATASRGAPGSRTTRKTPARSARRPALVEHTPEAEVRACCSLPRAESGQAELLAHTCCAACRKLLGTAAAQRQDQ